MDDALFDLPDDGATRDPPATLQDMSYTARLTARQAAKLATGWHPLGTPLHPDAAPVDDRKAPGLRCRSCEHLTHQGGTSGSYLKCEAHLITRGPGTDVRAWWPACNRYERVQDQ